MNWRNMFKGSEVLTEDDRKKLEALDASTVDLQNLLDRIGSDFCGGQGRIDKLSQLAEHLASNPKDQKGYQRLLMVAGMPSHPHFAASHIEHTRRPIEVRIGILMEPQHVICRNVFKRALAKAEAELKKAEDKARKEAEDDDVAYVPNGKILALQHKVLTYRNEVAAKCPGEEGYNGNRHWRERLVEFL